MKERFRTHSINAVFAQVVTLAGAGLTAIVISRVLGPADRGEYALILMTPWLLVTLGRLGLGHAVNYYASKTSPTILITNSVVLSLGLSAVLMFVAYLFGYFFHDTFFHSIDRKLMVLMVLFVPLYVFSNHFVSLLQGLYKITLRNALPMGQSLLNLLLLLALIVFWKQGLRGALIASLASLALMVSAALAFLWKEIDPKEMRLDFVFMKGLLKYGFQSHVGNVLKDLSYRSDILIIGYFLSPEQVGYYVTAVTVAEVLWIVPDAVGSVLLPRVASLSSEEAKAFTPAVSRIVMIAVSLLCLVLFLLGRPMIGLAFGEKFLPAVSVLFLLLPGVLALTVWKILANDLIGRGFPTQYSVTSGVALVTMVALDLWLIPRFGIKGAAVASTVSYVFATLAIVAIYVRTTGNSIRDLVVPSKGDFFLYRNMFKGA